MFMLNNTRCRLLLIHMTWSRTASRVSEQEGREKWRVLSIVAVHMLWNFCWRATKSAPLVIIQSCSSAVEGWQSRITIYMQHNLLCRYDSNSEVNATFVIQSLTPGVWFMTCTLMIFLHCKHLSDCKTGSVVQECSGDTMSFDNGDH